MKNTKESIEEEKAERQLRNWNRFRGNDFSDIKSSVAGTNHGDCS